MKLCIRSFHLPVSHGDPRHVRVGTKRVIHVVATIDRMGPLLALHYDVIDANLVAF
jgi:hypothetical protein